MSQDWIHNAAAYADLLGRAAEALVQSPWRDHCCERLPARGRAVITGDVHDDLEHFRAALVAAALHESCDHHIVLQEIIHGEGTFDGLDRSHRILAHVAGLVLAYPGQVHPILANHEIGQARGHPITKGGFNCTEAFDRGLDEAYGDDAAVAADAVRRFILAMPLGVFCAGHTLVTHSLPNRTAMWSFDVRVFERDLDDEDFDPPEGAAHLMTWGRSHDAEQLAALAREWRVQAFVVGHAPAPAGVEYRAPNMVVLNTGHDEGRLIRLELAAPAMDAQALAASALSVRDFVRPDPDTRGHG